MADKNSFVMYKDWGKLFDMLTDEEAGKMIKSVFLFQETGEVNKESFSDLQNMLFLIMSDVFQRDNEKYEIRCEKNRANASNRKQSQANANERKQSVAKRADNDNDNDNDNENGNENESENENDNINNIKEKNSKKKFTPPTFEEVEAYAKERGREDLAKKFFDWYEAGEWKDGKGNQVKGWKQKFQYWESKNEKPKQPQERVYVRGEDSL